MHPRIKKHHRILLMLTMANLAIGALAALALAAKLQ